LAVSSRTKSLGGGVFQSISILAVIPLGGVTFLLIAIFFENPRQATYASLPWKLKASRLVSSITSLLLAIQWGGSNYGLGDVRIIVLLSLSVLLIGVFGLQQWAKGDDATLPPRIICH
jgi:hypothetical protein